MANEECVGRFQLALLAAGIGIALALMGAVGLVHPSTLGRGSLSQLDRTVRHPIHAYCMWRIDRETKAALNAIRSADIWLEANGGEFSRIKPPGPDGKPVRVFGKDVLPNSIMPPADVGGRATVAVGIPCDWLLRPGTTNASGTDMEAFALEVAMKLKACGVHRITVYQIGSGGACRIFDGEVPSRAAIDAQVRRLMTISQ